MHIMRGLNTKQFDAFLGRMMLEANLLLAILQDVVVQDDKLEGVSFMDFLLASFF